MSAETWSLFGETVDSSIDLARRAGVESLVPANELVSDLDIPGHLSPV
jgi:hypothetical protein